MPVDWAKWRTWFALFLRFFITAQKDSTFLAKLDGKRNSGGSNGQNIEHAPVYRAGFALYITLGITMSDPRLWKIWGIAEANLKDARRYLIDAATAADFDERLLTQFDEYLAHNEFGLALEEIAELADGLSCKAAFWKRLESAAEVMELSQLASEYRERFHAEVHRG